MFAFGATCLAQEHTPAKPAEDVPRRAVVSEVRPLPEGGLLFAVRLYASQSKPLNLSRPHAPITRDPRSPKVEGEDDPLPFSLEGSTLRDTTTNKVYKCLPSVPLSPFVGPMEITTLLRAGSWMQLGVAFPALPPPTEKDGKKQPYQLLFEIPELKIHTPLKLDPETFKTPFRVARLPSRKKSPGRSRTFSRKV